MAKTESDKDLRKNNNEDAPLRPDSETLHKTDPQENMKGPVSSLMHNTGESFDTSETREEANEEKEKNM